MSGAALVGIRSQTDFSFYLINTRKGEDEIGENCLGDFRHPGASECPQHHHYEWIGEESAVNRIFPTILGQKDPGSFYR